VGSGCIGLLVPRRLRADSYVPEWDFWTNGSWSGRCRAKDETLPPTTITAATTTCEGPRCLLDGELYERHSPGGVSGYNGLKAAAQTPESCAKVCQENACDGLSLDSRAAAQKQVIPLTLAYWRRLVHLHGLLRCGQVQAGLLYALGRRYRLQLCSQLSMGPGCIGLLVPRRLRGNAGVSERDVGNEWILDGRVHLRGCCGASTTIPATTLFNFGAAFC